MQEDIGSQRAAPKSLSALKAELNIVIALDAPDVGKWKATKYSEEHKEKMQETVDSAMKILNSKSGSIV